MSGQPDQVEAGEGPVDLLQLPAPTERSEVDGKEPGALEERGVLVFPQTLRCGFPMN